MVLRNNYLYNTNKVEDHHYEEPKEQDNRILFNIQNNIQVNEQIDMQGENEINENYESVEEKDTPV